MRRAGRMIRWLFRLGIAALLAATLAVAGSTWLGRSCSALIASGSSYDTAIVLGGGIEEDGSLGHGSLDRALAGAALFGAGAVDRLHFTGRGAPDGTASVAERMADRARVNGVPDAAMTVETRSASTLQNALFSVPMLEDAGELVLVTEGFHLWRGVASMAWAGRPVAAACKSAPFAPGRSAAESAGFAGREVLAWGYNTARALFWSAGHALGLDARLPDGLLD